MNYQEMKWQVGEVWTTKDIAAYFKISTPAAFKLCVAEEAKGMLSRYGYRCKGGLGGWEAPNHSTRHTQSLGWQYDPAL